MHIIRNAVVGLVLGSFVLLSACAGIVTDPPLADPDAVVDANPGPQDSGPSPTDAATTADSTAPGEDAGSQDTAFAPADAGGGLDAAAAPADGGNSADAGPPAGGCCATDSDCNGDVCAQSIGNSGGVCVDPSGLTKGQCWTDAQCEGGVCENANICPCGAMCAVADQPGTCKPKVNPCATVKCGDGNPCTSDKCDPATGQCVFTAVAAGAPCSDGNPCTVGDHCGGAQNANCLAGKLDPNCGAGPCCKGDGDCKTGHCANGANGFGVCKMSDGLNKGQCWTDSDCGEGSCKAASVCPCNADCDGPDAPGTCEPKPNPCATVKCGAGTQCSLEVCDPATGKCVPTPKAAGTKCEDGDPCTIGDTCDGTGKAQCLAGEPDPKCGGGPCVVGGMGPAKVCPVAGEFCKLALGKCVGGGVCTVMPKGCPENLDYVCGCDGKTYTNTCEADAVGVGVVAKGKCKEPVPPGCCSPEQGCEAGKVCFQGPFSAWKCMDIKSLQPGQCWTDAQCNAGKCEGASACGCKAACKAMDKPGTCVKPDLCGAKKCDDGNPCTTDSCDPASGNCLFKPKANGSKCDDGDACTSGDICTQLKDGAKCAGTPIQGCGGDKFCSIGLGAPTIDCGAAGYCKLNVEWGCIGLGKCAAKPQGCFDVDAPVCGCNSKSYSNSCMAAAAGQNMANKGVCVATSGCCSSDLQCKVGHCANGAGGNGVCKVSDGLGKGQCWTDADCGGAKCDGASVCPCKVQCFAADKPGTCLKVQ